MKRLRTTAKYKRLMRIRHLRSLYTVRRKKQLQAQPHKRVLPLVHVAAPETFSMKDNPEDTIRFLTSVASVGGNKRVFVDLARTTVITSDASAVLAATIESERCQAKVFGNWPHAKAARQLLLDSGFRQRVRTDLPPGDDEKGTIVGRKVYLDRIHTAVVPEPARQLVEFAKDKLGRESEDKPSYGILIDVMSNTFTHASAVMEGQVSWWATVYCDTERGKACYCFVDLGVGIFKSKSFQQRVRYVLRTGLSAKAERMRALLHRQIPSRTGLPYRGKGLPWIYESGLAGRIESLAIIANDIYARPLQDEYRALSRPFHGTFLYWET
jgi:hypothetical protein